MTRLDVITDVGVFVLDINPTEYLDGDSLINLTDLPIILKKSVLSGDWFYGWTPYDDINTTPRSAISIESGAQVKGCKLYEYHPVGVDRFTTEATPTPTTPYPFTCFGEYLGNSLKITGVAFKTPTTEYLLPIFVNDQAATDFMKPAPLSQQIQLCKEAEGLAPTEYLIIIPDVWQTPGAAAEYLVDYVKEAEPTTKVEGGGKAKAWPGWSE